MMNKRSFMVFGAVASVGGLGACGVMTAMNTTTLRASLLGATEVPPNTSEGTGTLRAALEITSNELSWTLSYSDLSGFVKAAHFHGPAEPGSNAPVVLPFTGSLETPIIGSATLTPEQAKDLLAGKWYVNLHTAAHPGGEIRGQVLALK